MFEKILVALDGSESSLHALRETFRLARAEKSAVRVVSVVPPYEEELSLVGVKKGVVELMREPFQKALVDAAKTAEAHSVRIQASCEEGEPHETIVDLAEAEHCNLIVVGVRGCNPANQVLMGSLTARVIGYSRTDILVVPLNGTFGLDKILFAIDGSKFSDGAMQRAFTFHRTYGSKLYALSVADVPPHLYGVSPAAAEGIIANARENLVQVEQKADAAGVLIEPLLREGDPAQLITDIAETQHIELIVIGSHGRSGLGRLLMGSVTERVIGHARCPVLVTRS